MLYEDKKRHMHETMKLVSTNLNDHEDAELDTEQENAIPEFVELVGKDFVFGDSILS